MGKSGVEPESRSEQLRRAFWIVTLKGIESEIKIRHLDMTVQMTMEQKPWDISIYFGGIRVAQITLSNDGARYLTEGSIGHLDNGRLEELIDIMKNFFDSYSSSAGRPVQ